MNKFELWSVDEYGQGSIVERSTDLDSLVERAKKEVNEINVNNALTSDEKMRNWEAYFVEMEDGAVYAGNRPDGRHRYFEIDGDDVAVNLVGDESTVRFYLGELGNKETQEPWYAEPVYSRSKDPEPFSLSDQVFEDKTVFFIKPV